MLDGWKSKRQGKWTREDVRNWLQNEGIYRRTAEMIYQEKITGADIKLLTKDYLGVLNIEEKQINQILEVRDKLVESGNFVNIKSKLKISKPSNIKPPDSGLNTGASDITPDIDCLYTAKTVLKDNDSPPDIDEAAGVVTVKCKIPDTKSSEPAPCPSSIDSSHGSCMTKISNENSKHVHVAVEISNFIPQPVANTDTEELILPAVPVADTNTEEILEKLGPKTILQTNIPTSADVFVNFICIPRNFDKPEDNVEYRLNSIFFAPETGSDDKIRPCREYKAVDIQETHTTHEILERIAGFSNKVIRFAAGCLNARTNGTIYFGVRDSKKTNCYEHGQVTGLYVKEKDVFIDKLTESISNCFEHTLVTTVTNCIRPPRFIRVVDDEHPISERTFVIEVDVVPSSEHTEKRAFPIIKHYKYIEKDKKWRYVEFGETIFMRLGPTTKKISFVDFQKDIDSLYESRVSAEKIALHEEPTKLEDVTELAARRVRILLTKSKEAIDKSTGYIVVTNRCQPENLEYLNFLSSINLMCVFDFDPASYETGLCCNYRKDSPTTKLHSLNEYFGCSDAQDLRQYVEHFKQTSWVFCCGRTDIPGVTIIESDRTWIQMESRKISKAIQLLCDYPLPLERMIILFLVHSSAMILPLKKALTAFHEQLQGFDHIVCIAEEKTWFDALVDSTDFDYETILNRSIIDLKLSDISSILGTILPDPNFEKRLATSNKGTCVLKSRDEERMASLEIIKANELDDKSISNIENEDVKKVEQALYRGGQITWTHLWLAENHPNCQPIIERDTHNSIDQILYDILIDSKRKETVTQITVFHQPGSGGSTVTRQILWKYRKKFRCAVIKTLYSSTDVCKHAIDLQRYGEPNPVNFLPVMLLVDSHQEFCEIDFLLALKRELRNAISGNRLSFIIFACKQDMNPKTKPREVLPDLAVDVVHELSRKEKKLFGDRVKYLEEEKDVSLINPTSGSFEIGSILTFVLMSQEFKEAYVTEIVQNVLKGINPASKDTSLIKYVALLHSFGRNSTLSRSHCEAFMNFNSVHWLEKNCETESKFPEYDRFKTSLSQQANFLFKFFIDTSTNCHLEFVQIVHVIVAKEVLRQLAVGDPYSKIALDFLKEDALVQHKPLQTAFKTMMVQFFLTREKNKDGKRFQFSPFIQHMWVNESKEIAVKVAEYAYACLGPKQALIAQMIARLYIQMSKFELGEKWITRAKKDFSNVPNFGLLHTEGRVFRGWFDSQLEQLEPDVVKLSEVHHLVKLALRAMTSFMESHEAAISKDRTNNYAYVDHIETLCKLLKLLARLDTFRNIDEPDCSCKLVSYLCTDKIPQELESEDNWKVFHKQLKGLKNTACDNLDWISYQLCCFQKSRDNEDDELTIDYDEHLIEFKESHDQINTARLHRCSKEFATYLFCRKKEHKDNLDIALTKQMQIYRLGGGTLFDILTLLSEEKNAEKLEELLSMYDYDETRSLRDKIHYIFVQLALSCTKSEMYCSLKELQRCCYPLHRRYMCTHDYYFLQMMLYWPQPGSSNSNQTNLELQYGILEEAITHLHIFYSNKRKDSKQRLYTPFYLGNGTTFNRDMFIHKSRLEKLISNKISKGERGLMWRTGKVWEQPKFQRILKPVDGWSSGGEIYVTGHLKKTQIKVQPINMPSWLRHSNEPLSFYLGFSFNGPVACNVQSRSA